MPVSGLVSYPFFVVVLVIALLSGVFSVVREVQIMYFLPVEAESRKKQIFWAFVRIAFVVAAVVLWLDERTKVTSLEKLLPDSQPLSLLVKLQQTSLPDMDSTKKYWILRSLVFPSKHVKHAQLELSCNLYGTASGLDAGVFPIFPDFRQASAKLSGHNTAHIEVSDMDRTNPLQLALWIDQPPTPQDYCDVRILSAE
jgi:hypothetical protein